MKEISIKGTHRSALGKKASKEIRNAGEVPCVVYGIEKGENGMPAATAFSISAIDANKLIFTPHVYVVNIELGDKNFKTIIKEVQFHSVKDSVLHIDFFQISPEKPITIAIPIATKGLAVGVRAGGKLAVPVRKLKVRAKFEIIPEKLIIDVTNLSIAKSIKVGDLSFEGLELMTSKEVVVATVKATRAAAADATTDEDAADAETSAPAAE